MRFPRPAASCRSPSTRTGSKINVAQMVACVGQQAISGARVPDGFQDRSLPHFPKGAKEPAAKGFVVNSFFSGLTATEFLFHAISGREGLVDTAVKTAETGYMARRLMKVRYYSLLVTASTLMACAQALEDLSTRYDNSVRNSVGGIVQFTYGDDGLDPVSLEGDAEPVNFVRTWSHARALRPLSKDDISMLPFEIQAHIAQTLGNDKFAKCHPNYREALADFGAKHIVLRAALVRTKYGFAEMLSPPDGMVDDDEGEAATRDDRHAVVVNKTEVTKRMLDKFLDLCLHKYLRAMIEPGELVRPFFDFILCSSCSQERPSEQSELSRSANRERK